MNLFRNLEINASALTAERLRMDLISNNIANANTTRTANGEPYRRQVPVFAEALEKITNGQGRVENQTAGVKVLGIREVNTSPRLVYDPAHPDADANGYVTYPEINIVNEMVNLISASRAYEANITTFNAGKDQFRAALEIGRA